MCGIHSPQAFQPFSEQANTLPADISISAATAMNITMQYSFSTAQTSGRSLPSAQHKHQDAVFFEHSTNMLHISHLLWLSAYHCKEHILYSSTHHKWHSSHHPPMGDSFIEWGTSHQPFNHGLITLPWHFHKQEMKIYHSVHN